MVLKKRKIKGNRSNRFTRSFTLGKLVSYFLRSPLDIITGYIGLGSVHTWIFKFLTFSVVLLFMCYEYFISEGSSLMTFAFQTKERILSQMPVVTWSNPPAPAPILNPTLWEQYESWIMIGIFVLLLILFGRRLLILLLNVLNYIYGGVTRGDLERVMHTWENRVEKVNENVSDLTNLLEGFNVSLKKLEDNNHASDVTKDLLSDVTDGMNDLRTMTDTLERTTSRISTKLNEFSEGSDRTNSYIMGTIKTLLGRLDKETSSHIDPDITVSSDGEAESVSSALHNQNLYTRAFHHANERLKASEKEKEKGKEIDKE